MMTASSAPSPFAWLGNSSLRTWLLIRGLVLLGIGLGLSLLLALLLIFFISAGASQVFSGFSSFGTSSGQGPTAGQLTGALLVIVGFVFFTAHLAPYSADISLLGSSIYGVGSLLITAIVVVAAYRAGRKLERLFPDSLSNSESAMRASSLVVPYWLGAFVLFLLSSIHAQSSTSTYAYTGSASVGPSPLGLITPLVLVGLAAALGARRERARSRPRSETSSSAIRGGVLALFAISIGILGSLVGVIIAALIGLAIHSSALSPTSSGSGPTPTFSPTGVGPLFTLLGILVGIFYLPNGLFWLWGNTLGLGLQSTGWLALALGVIGALLGALTVRPRADRVEQVSFAASFGLASFILAFISRPTLGAYALGASPWTVLGVGLVVGTILALIGPYAAVTGLGRSVLETPLMAAALRRLPLPGGGAAPAPAFPAAHTPTEGSWAPGSVGTAGSAREDWGPSRGGAGTAVMAPPAPARAQVQIRFGRRAKLATGVAIAVIAALIGVNFYLSSATSAPVAASAYEQAVGDNNADAIWSHLIVNEPTGLGALVVQGAPRLLSAGDLRAMLGIAQNKHQTHSNITIGRVSQNGDAVTVQVSFEERGQKASETLVLVRDGSQHQFLFYPVWKVVESAGTVAVSLPAKGSRVAVDGTQLPADVGTAVVLPGTHKMTLLAFGPFAATDQIAVVQPSMPAQVTFSKLQLTPEAQSMAAAAIKSFFNSCAQTTTTYGGGNCPQHINEYVTTPIQWQLVGDPSLHLVVSVDASQTITASTHYLMTASYTDNAGLVHRVAGGSYAVSMTWNGQALDVQGPAYFSNPPPPLANPAASPATVLTAVQAGWQACLKATVLDPPDCPASAYGYQPTNITWSSNSDPMAGAQVVWDGNAGLYKVTGNYSLTATFSDSFGTARKEPLNGSYTGYVIWDGQTAKLVNIAQGNQ